MIGSLTGEIQHLEGATVILNVGGVGYEVDTPLSTFCQLKRGETVTLWTHFVVREDAQQLYGFCELQDKLIFRTLLKVNGIGAKMALGILSSLSVEMLIHCIEHEDVNTLVKVPGIGKKTAERLIIELRDRRLLTGHARRRGGTDDAPRRRAGLTRIAVGCLRLMTGAVGATLPRRHEATRSGPLRPRTRGRVGTRIPVGRLLVVRCVR